MMLSPVFERFVVKSPISVMARGMIERALNPEQLDEWFNETADEQYTWDLLCSWVCDIMSHVVCGGYASVYASYQASKEEIGVSITSVYNKLNGIETGTSAALVRYAAEQVEPIIKKLAGTGCSPLPGLRIKLLDWQLYREKPASYKGVACCSVWTTSRQIVGRLRSLAEIPR